MNTIKPLLNHYYHLSDWTTIKPLLNQWLNHTWLSPSLIKPLLMLKNSDSQWSHFWWNNVLAIPSFIPLYYHVVMVKFKTAIPIMDCHLLFHLSMVNDGIMVYFWWIISPFLRRLKPSISGWLHRHRLSCIAVKMKKKSNPCVSWSDCEMRSVVVGKSHVYVGWIMLLFCCIWLLKNPVVMWFHGSSPSYWRFLVATSAEFVAASGVVSCAPWSPNPSLNQS